MKYPYVYLKTKVKNAISKSVNAEFKLENTTINGVKKGCYGWIANKDNGKIVYIDTERSCCDWCNFLHRYAKDFHDYTGETNCFSNTFDEFIDDVVKMLRR